MFFFVKLNFLIYFLIYREMSSTVAPKIVNGELNSVFNTTDFVPTTDGKNDAKYDAKYLKISGGTLTGGLTTPSLTNNGAITTTSLTSSSGTINGTLATSTLTVNNAITTTGITSTGGTNQFNSNITLPTTYTATPNSTQPSSSQLGGFLSVSASNVATSTGTVTAICSLVLNSGVWLVCWRGSIYPSATGSGTYSNVRLGVTTTSGSLDHTTDIQQRVSIASSQTCTFGATNGYDVSLMGSTIFRPTTSTTYFLNGASVYTSTPASQWRGHIHAVRIA